MIAILIILIVLIAVAVLVAVFGGPADSGQKDAADNGEWEYGDVWKEKSVDIKSFQDVEYMEILRGDTGSGFDDSYMMDLVGYLGSRGVRATYDSYSVALEGGAIKTYVLKVEAGKENEAIGYLKEKE